METKTRKIVLISVAIVSLLGIGLFWKLIYYGSVTRSCIYTEEALPVPENLAQGEIVVSQGAYQVGGQELEYSCLPSIGRVGRELVGPEMMRGAPSYFSMQGRPVDAIAIGKRFHVVGVISVTKHGLTTIDSGSGPMDYLILEDGGMERYSLAVIGLGLNKRDFFLNFESPSGIRPLEIDNFRRHGLGPFLFTDESFFK